MIQATYGIERDRKSKVLALCLMLEDIAERIRLKALRAAAIIRHKKRQLQNNVGDEVQIWALNFYLTWSCRPHKAQGQLSKRRTARK